MTLEPGGELIEETLSGNVTEDFTTLEFIKPDGTIITHLVDFKNEVQIFQALILGEEERGQSQYQVMCFVTKVDKGDYIASDAISKLRQKNPRAERQAEDELPELSYQMEVRLHLNRSAAVSPHVRQLCGEAGGATYSRHQDIQHVAAHRAADLDAPSLDQLERALSPLPPATSEPRCSSVSSLAEPCRCRYHLCISWYPCSLKYCKGRDADGQTVSYRCGIRTCRRCHVFDYSVTRKQLCLWDEEPRDAVNLMSIDDDDDV
ncbi:out at first protein-like [Amphibalanus amphitrite]|uniref:out at first protein-like n=1 Tax=Amphibalanus amphitrite TaxID=1232801 RepID=UPI001C90DA87|nr:out at first protein-like [Amphibalanus amphitrite]